MRVAALAGLAVSICASGAQADLISVPTCAGVRTIEILSPDAATSPGGNGWAFRARVVVRIARGDDGRRLIDTVLDKRWNEEERQGRIPLLTYTTRAWDGPGPLADFWYVDVSSVREAAEVASALRVLPGVVEAYVDSMRPRVKRSTVPTDPDFAQQWYLQPPAATGAGSVNVIPAWKAGITGAGVTVGVIEEGFNIDHPDLSAKINLPACQDPIHGFTFEDHATACAGLVGMAASNGMGGAGVAYGAQLSRQYYGFDSDTAAAFAYRSDLNHIKSASFGPPDIGTLATISSVELAGLETAASTGRGGLGAIFSWAAGNGDGFGDRVNYDPYASSRFVMAVGSIDRTDRHATYSERGTSLMLVTTSSYDFFGSDNTGIYSTTGSATVPPGDYNAFFGGTSAAAPIAAGVAALVLQANPNLSARDVQHLLIETSRRVNPDDEGWSQNASGRWFNESFGFGAINAAAAVQAAPTFRLRGSEIVSSSALVAPNLAIPDDDLQGVSSSVAVPANIEVERAQVVLDIEHPFAGDLRIQLVSPGGTSSLLAEVRNNDHAPGYQAYTLTTLKSWGEHAAGTWTLRVADLASGSTGTLQGWRLVLTGSTPRCPVDYDRDQVVTIDDIFVFLNVWFAGLGDFDNSGAATIDDIFIFLNAWFAGC